MKTEKMNSQEAIDFLFDQTGKLRTTRVRHNAMITAISIITTALREARSDAQRKSRILDICSERLRKENDDLKTMYKNICGYNAQYITRNLGLSNELSGLKDKLKHEEDRAAAFAHRNIELANENEKLKKEVKLIESFAYKCDDKNKELEKQIRGAKTKKKFFNAFSV